jgi:hypothetical protein
VPELKEPLTGDQIFESMNPKITQLDVHERSRCRRHEDLATVSSAHDPRRSVDIDADVPIVRNEWLAGVNTDPNACPTISESVLRAAGSNNCVARSGEREEEGVSLRVDLDAPCGGARLPDDAPVLGQGLRVDLGAERMQESRRSLDVRD